MADHFGAGLSLSSGFSYLPVLLLHIPLLVSLKNCGHVLSASFTNSASKNGRNSSGADEIPGPPATTTVPSFFKCSPSTGAWYASAEKINDTPMMS